MKVCLTLALALLVTITATAQDVTPETAAPFVETIDVNVVNIEVYVTDKHGQRVEGLTPDDFELTVDRRPVAIDYFYAIQNGQATAADRTLPEAEERQPRLENTVPRPVPEDQRLRLIVFVDNFNLRPFNRNRALAATRSFLRQRSRPGDELMLVSYDRSLRLRHPFTNDSQQIVEALFDLEDESGHRLTYDSERREMLEMIYDTETLDQIRGRASQHVQAIHNDLRFTLQTLQDHVESLAGLPGRKAILYVSDGLPLRAGADIYEALADRFPDDSSVRNNVFRYDLTRDFESLTRQANAHRVTFYTLDAAGLRSYTYSDASNGSLSGNANIDQAHFDNLQQPLRLMAAETGGLAILGTNDFTTPLNRVADDFDSYYSLGFSSAGVEGRYHDVKVRLKDRRKGVQLRHREGYRDKPTAAHMTERVLAALHYGAVSNPLGVELASGQAVSRGEGRYHVSFVVKIPIARLGLVPQDKLHRGRVRLFVGVQDSEGDLAPVHEQVEAIDIPSHQIESAKSQLYHLGLTLVMERGRHLVAVGVRDELGAAGGVALSAIDIGKSAANRSAQATR